MAEFLHQQPTHDINRPSTVLCIGLWSVVTLTLNLTWEFAHVRLYTIWNEADRMAIMRSVVHCSLGDVVISLSLFTIVGLILRQLHWPLIYPRLGGSLFVTGGLAFTVWSELFNVYRISNWNYTASMPTILGVGLTPLLQWGVLPIATVITYRMLLAFQFRDRFDTSLYASAPKPKQN